MTLQEQDLFLESDLQSSQEALMGRPYIAGASYKVQQVDEEYFDIFFTVNESKKSFDFGGSGQYEQWTEYEYLCG